MLKRSTSPIAKGGLYMMKLWEFVNELKSPAYCWVDLTHELSPATPHWYGFGDLTTEVIYDFSPDCIFHSDKYTIPAGQFGTHVDAPGHFVQGARTLDQMTLKEMVYPLVVIDKSAACAADADYELTIADLQEWEQEHGPIPEGAFVAFRSDWSKRPDMNNYDENNRPHYPGWKLDALHWLVEERHIGAIGHETADTDAPGANVNFAGEIYILETDRLQVELMTNLDALPPTGAVIFVTFPKVKNGVGFPARVFAVYPKE